MSETGKIEYAPDYKSGKHKPGRDPESSRVFKSIEHQRLRDAVVEAAKAWNALPTDYVSVTYGNDLDAAAVALGDAVDRLLQFEQEQSAQKN